MRRRLAFAAAGSAFALIFGAVPAFADNGPHVRGAGGVLADSCAGCHRIHTAKTDMLTKDVQPTLCYSCHGTSSTGATTDVVNGVGYDANVDPAKPYDVRGPNKIGALRGGGFEHALIDSSKPTGQTAGTKTVPALPTTTTAGTAVTSSHSVDGSTRTAWGNGVVGTGTVGTAIQLRCGSCHDPHGNGNYRILKPLPEQGTQSPGVNNTGVANEFSFSGTYTGVIADAATKVYTTGNYWASADANAPAYIANVAEWCSTCHTRYLATRDSGVDRTTGDPVPFTTNVNQRSRVNSGDATFTYRHTSSKEGRNCITCHVSHGSNAAMGEYSSQASAPGIPDVGSSKLLRIDSRGTCMMCHTGDVG